MQDGFCIAPWTNMHIHPTGTVRPCCISKLQLANMKKGETLEQAWNSTPAKKLRQEFIDGKRPASCQSCYDREASGVESVRQQLNKRYQDERYTSESLDLSTDTPSMDHARQLDISFTNDCNLTCKMCGPQCSTKWIELAKNLKTEAGDPLWKWYTQPNWERFELSASNLFEQLKKFPGIIDFEIKGGEPFISKQHDAFLNLLSELPQSENLMFRYVSNGTHISPATAQTLAKFNEKHLWVSVDGVGDLFKYIRGGKIGLERVEKNLKTLYAIPHTRLGVIFTLSIYNIFGLNDFWSWYQKMLIEMPNLDIFLGMVRSPLHLNITSFPTSLLQKALWQMPESDHHFLESVRTALKSAVNESMSPQILADFRSYTTTLDRHLNESLVKLSPEFEELLSSVEL